MKAEMKTALVTGASGGIGKSIADCFATAGVNLVVAARSETGLNALAEGWRSRHGVQVTVLRSDLAQAGAAESLFQTVRDQGIAIDYLVNNAGSGTFGLFNDSSLDAGLEMMTLNMTSLTILTKRFLPEILARKGKIMNVASTAAFQPGPYMAVYYATKAYVLSFSEALASELTGSGVTVTAFCPGATESGFQDKAAMQDSGLVKGKKLPSAEAVGRLGYAAMMAGATVYIPGALNKLMAASVRFTPRSVVTHMVKVMTGPK